LIAGSGAASPNALSLPGLWEKIETVGMAMSEPLIVWDTVGTRALVRICNNNAITAVQPSTMDSTKTHGAYKHR